MSEIRGPADFKPEDERVIDKYYGASFNGYFDGKLYQPANPEACDRRRLVIERALSEEAGFANLPVEDYQRWVELDWKEPHATYAMAERLYHKVAEEGWQEAPAEFDRIWPLSADKYKGQPSTEAVQRLLDELGDILWTVVAMASNGAVNLKDALTEFFYNKYPWRDSYYLKLSDIDNLVSDGYIPSIGPVNHEDIGTSHFDYDEMDPRSNLLYRAGSLRHLCDRQFGYGDTPFSYYSYHKVGLQEVAPVVVDVVLLTTYYAQQWGRATLDEVARRNVIKISGRVATNSIDKSTPHYRAAR